MIGRHHQMNKILAVPPPDQRTRMNAHGYAAAAAKASLTPFDFSRRELGPHDVAFGR
jgi:hypothetical protein